MALGTTAQASPDAPAQPAAAAVRWFGRFQLLRLLGKSDRTSTWRVEDPRTKQELLLVLPRVQPASPKSRDYWTEIIQQASRLRHPRLAAAVESGVQDGWPFVIYDPREDVTLAERLPQKGMPGSEAAALLIQLLEGLAFAHDAGVAHHDLQPYQLLLGEGGQLRLVGLSVAGELAMRGQDSSQSTGLEAGGLRSHRDAAERDVLAAGVLLHQMLTGQRALEEADIGRAIARLPPAGRDMMRLPFATSHPIAEPMRAIANRATDRQPRQRYRSARTLMLALEGWLASESGSGGGTMAELADRVRNGGAVPSSPGTAGRAARLASMANQHTSELAEVVLEDPALSFELLRVVNSARATGGRLSGGEPVLSVRRALAMVGLDGVRRVAQAMRSWPGTLGSANSPQAAELLQMVERCKRAGRVAQALRPPGYDAEVVYLVTLLQNLGRLVVQYHFADESQQIRRLMQPAPSPQPGGPEEPGMSEEGAAFAVLGADIEAIGSTVARQWGFDESVLSMIRRMPLNAAVHGAASDYEQLRTVAACANESVDAMSLPAPRVAAALHKVLQRYGRLLNITAKDLQTALQSTSQGGSAAAAAPEIPQHAAEG